MRSYICAGQYVNAINTYERLLATGAENLGELVWYLAYAYAKKGNIAKGVEFADRYVNEGGDELDNGLLYALLGMHEKAEALLIQMESAGVEYIEGPVALAVVMGQEDRGLTILERAVRDNPDRNYSDLNCLAETRSLRGNARYTAVLEKLDLPY